MISGPLHLEHVAAYRPGASVEEIQREYGLSNVEKLASNENPLGASPLAIEAAHQALSVASLYGDGGKHLRQKLASFHGVGVEQVSVNNGSDAIIHQIMRTLLLPGDEALSCHGGFVSFNIAVRTVGFEPQLVPLTPDYRFDVEALVAASTPRTKIIYIPNPNNPTGTHLAKDELEWLLERIPSTTLVVLDEAYSQYALHEAPDTYPDGLLTGRSNVLSLRTFSKAYGLAALRIGYAIGDASVVKWLLKTKLPFDPNVVACAAASAALDDQHFVQQTVLTNSRGLDTLKSALHANGYSSTQSVANFVMVDCGDADQATAFHRALLEHGFISRPLGGFGLPHCVRISTGTDDQNQRLAATLTALAEQFVTES